MHLKFQGQEKIWSIFKIHITHAIYRTIEVHSISRKKKNRDEARELRWNREEDVA